FHPALRFFHGFLVVPYLVVADVGIFIQPIFNLLGKFLVFFHPLHKPSLLSFGLLCALLGLLSLLGGFLSLFPYNGGFFAVIRETIFGIFAVPIDILFRFFYTVSRNRSCREHRFGRVAGGQRCH